MRSFILTLISPDSIKPSLKKIREILASRHLKVQACNHLHANFDSNPASRYSDAYALDVVGELKPREIRSFCQKLSNKFAVDAIIQTQKLAKTPKKLACFDMDSTLIQHEAMDELAHRHGIGEDIAAITASAMRGEISFAQSFYQRLARLKGFDASLIPEIAQHLKLTPGARTLIASLNSMDIKVVILSGGFEDFAIHLSTKLGKIDKIYANKLDIKDGKLTGAISSPLMDEQLKLSTMKELAQKVDCRSDETIAVGDGANDIPMIRHAGLGIAYRAKPVVQDKIACRINRNDLSSILYLLGCHRSDFVSPSGQT